MSRQEERGLLAPGLFLLNVIFFAPALATLGFFAGLSVGPLHFPAAVLLAAASAVAFQREGIKKGVLTAAVGLCVLALCLGLCLFVYDYSWDGNSYHKGIAGVLKLGWNPLGESFYSFAADYDFLSGLTNTWYDAYPKGSELFGACVYAFTGNIEAGKAFNLLSMAACFFLGAGLLMHTGLLKGWQALVCAALTVLTPTNLAQMLTYYNDGFLGNMLLLCLMGLLCISFYPEGGYKRLAGYLVFASISLGFNIKFSSIIFFAFLCLSFFLFWVAQEWKRAGISKGIRALGGRFLLLAGSVVSGLLFLGSTSYVTNTVRYHNPLYTMIGEGSTEIIESQLAPVFAPMSNFQRFIASLMSRTNESMSLEYIEWKIPFTFERYEIYYATVYDVRIGGWGVLFSGIFLISCAVILCFMLVCARKRRDVFWLSMGLSVMLVLAVVSVPGLCWARYFTSLYLVPVAALIFLLLWFNKRGGAVPLLLSLGMALLMAANTGPNLWFCADLLKTNAAEVRQVAEFKAISESKTVTVGYSEDVFEGRFFNLYDAGITDFSFGTVADSEADGKVFSRRGLNYTIETE